MQWRTLTELQEIIVYSGKNYYQEQNWTEQFPKMRDVKGKEDNDSFTHSFYNKNCLAFKSGELSALEMHVHVMKKFFKELLIEKTS